MSIVAGKNILITGGAGFIGSTLAGRLLEQNRVVVFDSFFRNALDSRTFKNHSNLEIIEGSVLDVDRLRVVMRRRPQIVVHCAAIAGIDTVIANPVETMRVNMVGSANVLELASHEGVERVLCFSSSEVFGPQAFMASEADPTTFGTVGEARWTYAVSKLAVEHLAMAYFQERGLPVCVVRPFNIYGPGQVGGGAIRTFVLRALAGEPLQIHGDGTQIRAWCFIDDLIEGLMLAMSNPRAIGESFNLGNQRAVTTIYGLAHTVVSVLKSKSPIIFSEKSYVDVELRVPAVRKARDLLGFEAKVDLEEGIRRTAQAFASGSAQTP
ncbi:MAG: NAD-dependent epimerase/dehydratase family protein [Deltaproteobacteria bacterium]|nr:NAD-dependent epimerase/dehydratase family protein [Deltaproteobacteria bacterium]